VILAPQRALELGDRVEVVGDVVLVAPQDDEDVIDARAHRLFDDVLDRGLVDDGEHLLRHRLGRGKEARAEAGGGDDGFDRGGAATLPGACFAARNVP
jgi:hypothetical protein